MSDEQNGFEDYIPQSMDPGNSMVIATVLFCVVLIAFLPCISCIAKRFQKHEGAPTGDTDSSEEDTKSKTPAEVAAKLQAKKKRSSDKATTIDKKQQKKQSKLSSDELKKLRGPGSVDGVSVVSPYHKKSTGSDYGNDDDADGDAKSSKSSRSSSSSAASVHSTRSAASAVINALLQAAPHANPVRTKLHAHKVQREHDNDDAQSHASDAGIGLTDSHSVLGKLSHDEVSIRDAVDTGSSVYHDALEVMDNNNSEKPSGLSSLCARLYSSWDRLLLIAEWNYESKRICKLGGPFVSQALVEGICEAVRVAIVGQFISTPALSAYVVVDLMVGLTTQFLSGFQNALATLCSHAVGGDNKKLAGQYVQLATIFYSLCYVPIFVLWSIFAGDTIAWLGFDPETVSIGHDFAVLFLFAEFLGGIGDSVHGLLDTIDLERYSTGFIVVQEILCTLAFLAVGMGTDTKTLQLVGVVLIAVNAIALVLNITIIVLKGWFDHYLDGLVGGLAILVRFLFGANHRAP